MVYHYINITVRGSYIDYDFEILAENGHEVGTTYDDYLKSKWVRLSDEQWAFKEQNPNASVKEVLDMQIMTLTEQQLFSRAVSQKIADLHAYRQSSAVKVLIYNGNGVWIEENERLVLKDKCNTVYKRGQQTVMVGSIYVRPEIGILMIEKMDEYDELCNEEVKRKEAGIHSLATKEELEALDIQTGWPTIIDITEDSALKEIKSMESNSPEKQAVEFVKQIVNEFDMPAKLALERQILFPVWKGQGAELGLAVKIGFRFNYKTDQEQKYKLYEVIQAHTLSEAWVPGIGTESLYKVVQVEHAGTLEDPIPWELNMEVFNGKYYTETDSTTGVETVYLGIRDSGQGMSFMLKDLVSAGYVEVVK